jgi:hypothetical protein
MLLYLKSKISYMKFQSGQKVLLLDTEFKPAGNAIVACYETNSNKYQVEFLYPGNDKADRISVPEERLIDLNEGPV